MKSIHAVFANDGEWFIARCLDYPVTTLGRPLAAAKKTCRRRWSFIGKPGVERTRSPG